MVDVISLHALTANVVQLQADFDLWVTTVVQETLEKKMEIIATRIYGAVGIELSEVARKKVELYTKQVCLIHMLLKRKVGMETVEGFHA